MEAPSPPRLPILVSHPPPLSPTFPLFIAHDNLISAIPDQIVVTAASSKPKGLSPGSIFAATFFPIAIVIAGIFLYIWFARSKQAKKRQRFSVHVGQCRASS